MLLADRDRVSVAIETFGARFDFILLGTGHIIARWTRSISAAINMRRFGRESYRGSESCP
jgi:hypothetical protein